MVSMHLMPFHLLSSLLSFPSFLGLTMASREEMKGRRKGRNLGKGAIKGGS
jgi:hypothetical protein